MRSSAAVRSSTAASDLLSNEVYGEVYGEVSREVVVWRVFGEVVR